VKPETQHSTNFPLKASWSTAHPFSFTGLAQIRRRIPARGVNPLLLRIRQASTTVPSPARSRASSPSCAPPAVAVSISAAKKRERESRQRRAKVRGGNPGVGSRNIETRVKGGVEIWRPEALWHTRRRPGFPGSNQDAECRAKTIQLFPSRLFNPAWAPLHARGFLFILSG